jgi:flavin reductase (DIM6/NTAB) family NADH-FMN oxidoreductase RutF
VPAVTTRDVSPEEFRRTVGLFTTGVTVVTTCHGDILHGMTANAFASVSLDPLLVLVCVDVEAGMHDLLPQSRSFAVSVLAAGQEEESIWFASPRRPAGTDQFDEVDWEPAPASGCPVVAGALAWLDCRVTEVHQAGDHSIFVGEVVDLGTGTAVDPLLYFGGAYRALAPAAPPDLPV